MLVLNRKQGERIVIGGNIVISIVRVQGERVRIGVTAPTEVPVHREEVFQRVAKESFPALTACLPGQSAYHVEFA